jgi:hypothetical protein
LFWLKKVTGGHGREPSVFIKCHKYVDLSGF